MAVVNDIVQCGRLERQNALMTVGSIEQSGNDQDIIYASWSKEGLSQPRHIRRPPSLETLTSSKVALLKQNLFA